ncbi:hypothetical protein G7054_g12834 [Neopestalotiopsis clavispora]|nr:hypothetical protein G7054_g12834 [Neopestalotiopsis clavispora]
MLDYIAPQMSTGTKRDIRFPDPIPYYEGRLGGFNLGNLSAWLQDRPLIIRFKDALGQSMIDLVFMVAAVRFPEANNLADVLLYFDQVGYLDFENNLSKPVPSCVFTLCTVKYGLALDPFKECGVPGARSMRSNTKFRLLFLTLSLRSVSRQRAQDYLDFLFRPEQFIGILPSVP